MLPSSVDIVTKIWFVSKSCICSRHIFKDIQKFWISEPGKRIRKVNMACNTHTNSSTLPMLTNEFDTRANRGLYQTFWMEEKKKKKIGSFQPSKNLFFPWYSSWYCRILESALKWGFANGIESEKRKKLSFHSSELSQNCVLRRFLQSSFQRTEILFTKLSLPEIFHHQIYSRGKLVPYIFDCVCVCTLKKGKQGIKNPIEPASCSVPLSEHCIRTCPTSTITWFSFEDFSFPFCLI